MSDKDSSSSKKWDKLDTLIFFAGGYPHEKARSYGLDKAWSKYETTSTSSYGSSTSTGGASSVAASKASDSDKDKPAAGSDAKDGKE